MTTTTLATLTGSEKQIAWASEVREKLIPGFDALHAQVVAMAEQARTAGTASEENIVKAIDQISTRIADTLNVADSSWWIMIGQGGYPAKSVVGLAMRDGYTK